MTNTHLERRQCCHEGCSASCLGGAYSNTKWYRVYHGFMSHACPEHREIWEAYDKANQRYENKRSKAYDSDLKTFEEKWEREWEKENTTPEVPPYQSSIQTN